MRSLAGPTLGVAAMLVAVPVLRASAAREHSAADTYESVYYLPPPATLRVASLGHDEALADLIWCRALVYVGEEFIHREGADQVLAYTDAMLALDPDFRAVYRWVGTAAVYQPDDVTAADVEGAIAVLERGRERFPEDGELAWITGATLAFELPPLIPQEQRDGARLRGTEHLMDALRLGAAPEWLVLANSSMLARVGSAERAAEHLEEMYATISDESVREEIRARISDLRSEAFTEAFIHANDELEHRRFRERPYTSPTFFELIVERPEEDFLRAMRDGLGHAVLEDPLALSETDEPSE